MPDEFHKNVVCVVMVFDELNMLLDCLKATGK